MRFLTSNDWQFRLLRTIIQGVIGVLVANLDVLINSLIISPTLKPLIVALCMAVLSPIMAELGRATEKPESEDVVIPYKPMEGDKHD